MNGPRRAWLRAGLVLLTLTLAGGGAWQYFAPRSFYSFPTVDADPPFNEHLMTDIGGLSLALAVVLGAAALRMERGLVQAALTGYLVYSVSHLAFHATHRHGLPTTEAILLLTALALLPVFALTLLVIATRDGRAPDRSRPGAERIASATTDEMKQICKR